MRQAKEEAKRIYPEEVDSQVEEIENLMDNEPAQFEPGEEGDIKPMDSDREVISKEEAQSLMDCERQIKVEIDETDTLPEVEKPFKLGKDLKKVKESDHPKTAEEDIVSKIEKDLERGLEKAKELEVDQPPNIKDLQDQSLANYEEHLRMTTDYSEQQIQKLLNAHRKSLGVAPVDYEQLLLTQKMRQWIQGVSGIFSNKQLMEEMDIPKSKKAQVSKNLNRLVDERLIIKASGKYGNWRRVEEDLQEISLHEKVDRIVDIKLPFGLNDMVETRPGNIICLAGFPNAGKTSLILNMIADNMYNFKCHLFSSEMGRDEMTMRLGKFKDVPWEDWDKYLKAYSRTEHFGDVIRPGEGNINFIDYIEMADEFYKIGGYLTEIHNKLNGAVAVIALQKNPGTDVARGGYGSLEKPRLYISIDPGRIKIVKAKNWKGKTNPNKLEMTFKLHHGTEFQPTSGWLRLEPKKRGK